jgi:hypothetical protein
LNGKRVVIENLKLNEKTFEENKGKVLIDWKNLNPCVIDITLKPEWKKWMDWISFKSGYLK